jgi:cell division septation protein DedD
MVWAMVAWLLAGCANVNEAGAPVFARTSPHAGFEQQHLTQARQQTAEGDLAEAAFHWEVLTVLRPDEKEYEDKLAQTRAQIERATSELMRNGREAQRKGAWEEATQRYLALLALAPDDKAAAQALRAVERERIRRDQLNKYSSRQLQQPRIPVRMPAMPAAQASPVMPITPVAPASSRKPGTTVAPVAPKSAPKPAPKPAQKPVPTPAPKPTPSSFDAATSMP